MRTYGLISADSHMDLLWLPLDVFTSRAPSKWKDRVPRVIETEEGPRWCAGDMDIAPVAGVGSDGGKGLEPEKGIHKQVDKIIDTGLYADGARGVLRPSTPELRLKDLDLDGIDAEVMYGILGVLDRLDPETRGVTLQIYNDWVAEFCQSKPERFAALALLPNHDPALAAVELRKAAKLGLRGAELSTTTLVKPLYHRDWDPLWAASAECAMPIAFHTRGLKARQPDPADQEAYQFLVFAMGASMAEFAGVEFLNSIILSGACDRHPGFKFVLGECGVSWIPHAVERMNYHYAARFHPLNLSMQPSGFWRRQGFTTFQNEGYAADVVDFVGEDNIMWGSDYPHHNGVWPGCQEAIQESLGRLDSKTQKKIICENAGRLYGFIN